MISGTLPESSLLRFRVLIYGTCRRTHRLIKRVTWAKEDSAEVRLQHLEDARRHLYDARLISCELARGPIEFP